MSYLQTAVVLVRLILLFSKYVRLLLDGKEYYSNSAWAWKLLWQLFSDNWQCFVDFKRSCTDPFDSNVKIFPMNIAAWASCFQNVYGIYAVFTFEQINRVTNQKLQWKNSMNPCSNVRILQTWRPAAIMFLQILNQQKRFGLKDELIMEIKMHFKRFDKSPFIKISTC